MYCVLDYLGFDLDLGISFHYTDGCFHLDVDEIQEHRWGFVLECSESRETYLVQLDGWLFGPLSLV